MNLFSIILIVLIAVVAYFHYLQGLFSATISAMLAVIAALLAFAFHEPLAEAIFGATITDYSGAICLIGLFALIYLLLRYAFDKMVPGNVRFPPAADKIGGAVMGVVAGLFVTGIIAVAAQTLPVGPSVAGYARYRVGGQRQVSVTNANRQAIDASVSGELEDSAFNQVEPNPFDKAPAQKLLIPVDDLLVGLVGYSSNGGSLAGARSLGAVHPDYLQELFANRVGVQPGVRLAAVNLRGALSVTVDAAFALKGPLRQADVELPAIRKRSIPNTITAGPGQVLLVVRAMFDRTATDGQDLFVRFSTGAVRLVTPDDSASGSADHDVASSVSAQFFPIGTLEGAGLVMNSRPDDPFFVQVDQTDRTGADFVFLAKRDAVLTGPEEGPKFKDGVFLAFKRMARVDLRSVPVATSIASSPRVSVLRKPLVAELAAVIPFRIGPADVQATTDPRLFVPINVGTPNDQVKDQKLRTDAGVQWATVSLQGRAITTLDAQPVGPGINETPDAQYAVDRLFVPANRQLIVIAGAPAEDTDPWEWARSITEFELAFPSGNNRTEKVHPCGVWARVENADAPPRLFAFYTSQGAVESLQVPAQGKPTAVWMAFSVPANVRPTALHFKTKVENLSRR